MPFENPFLTLELRRRQNHLLAVQLGKRAVIPVVATLALSAFLAALPFPLPGGLRTAPLLALMLAYAGLGAGLAAGYRVLSAERQQRTLDELLLLPYSSGGWLAQKLLFSVILIVLQAAAAFPVALCGAVLGIVSAEAAWNACAGAVTMGLLWMAMLVPAEPGEERTTGRRGSITRLHLLGAVGLHFPRLMFGIFVPLLLLMPQQVDWHGDMLLFGARFPLWQPASLALAAAWLSAWGTTIERLEGTDRAARRAVYLRWLAFVIEWALFASLLWRLPSVRAVRAVPFLLLVLPLFSLAPRRGEARTRDESADPWLQPELEWLAKRWPNPMFLHDLRRHFRRGSLRRRALQWLPAPLFMVGLFVGARWLEQQVGMGTMGPVRQLGFFAAIAPFVTMALQAKTWWERERQAGGFDLLALTPIPSDQWVMGRMAASVLAQLSCTWSLIAMEVGWVIWFGGTEHWQVIAPILFGAFAVLVLSGASCGVPGIRPLDPGAAARYGNFRRDQGLGVVVILVLVFTTLLGSALSAVFPSLLLPAALLCVVELAAVIAWGRTVARQSVVGLELLRRGEAEWERPSSPSGK